MDHTQNYSPAKDTLYITGLALIVVTFLIFCIPVESDDFLTGSSLANYGIAVCYFLVLLISGRLRRKHLLIFFGADSVIRYLLYIGRQ